jgi:malonate-semialdehyde dehydrogenase (acetylating)/methylmalonate-semialdehyde dehydrogenase
MPLTATNGAPPTPSRVVPNYVGGRWTASAATEFVDVVNPATAEIIARTPLSNAAEVDGAVQAALAAFPAWRRTPPGERIQFLFKLKTLLEEHIDELARLITVENGKTFGEAKAEIRRGIENVEVACGIPLMMQGYNLEDVTPGVDEMQIRQPLGVVAAITPFNFPAMIPFWFLPYAIACGNTLILKPSERVPLTMRRAFELLAMTGLPSGVVNLVNGGRTVVDALIDHPDVRAISFVGSTPVAKHVYVRSAANGKRMQCQGGAKNHVIVLPDADMDLATQIIADSAFGCAGQRCLAVSVAVTVGDAQQTFRDAIAHAASAIRIGNGLEAATQMGPVITRESKTRIESLVAAGVQEGAKPVVDGRNARVDGCGDGNFIAPTVLDGLPADSSLANTEIFGPVLSLVHANPSTTPWSSSAGVPSATRRPSSPRAAQQPAASATKPPPATSASISASPLPWRTSPSAAGRRASSASSTARAATPSSSTRNRRSSSNAGPARKRASSDRSSPVPSP